MKSYPQKAKVAMQIDQLSKIQLKEKRAKLTKNRSKMELIPKKSLRKVEKENGKHKNITKTRRKMNYQIRNPQVDISKNQH